MNILLVGEYSRLHNSLKEGLVELGHHVVILGFKDGFKDYPVDFPLRKEWDSYFFRKAKAGLYKITGFDANAWFTYRQFQKNKKHFIGFDIVQFINENSFFCGYHYEKKMLKFLFENNAKAFLMCCSNDYTTVKYELEHPEKKSIMQPYYDGKIQAKDFANALKYTKPEFRKIHDYIYENIRGVIASDIDYHIPLRDHPKYLGMIPNPINIKKLEFQPMLPLDKIIIFHGINQDNYFKKGNDFFEEALKIIAKKYPHKTEIITTRSIPYIRYIELYNKAHILLDMVYAFDQGFNALEAMAKGKVVFTGAEKEFEEFYQLRESVNINAKPDMDDLVEKLSFLIENPSEIESISKRARAFVEKEHDYITVTKKYLNTWNQ